MARTVTLLVFGFPVDLFARIRANFDNFCGHPIRVVDASLVSDLSRELDLGRSTQDVAGVVVYFGRQTDLTAFTLALVNGVMAGLPVVIFHDREGGVYPAGHIHYIENLEHAFARGERTQTQRFFIEPDQIMLLHTWLEEAFRLKQRMLRDT